MSAKKIGAHGAATVVLLSGLAVPAVSGSGSERSTLGYGNGTELNRDYRHGISNKRMTKRQWIRKGATGRGAYKHNLSRVVHSAMDRDDDHIACQN